MAVPQKTMVLASQIDLAATVDEEQSSYSEYTEIEKGSILSGRYKIDSKIGEGGMGVVYSGADQQLDRRIAIKLLKRNVSQDAKAVETLKQEAQVSMMLTHPSIMRLINFEQDGEYAFLLMEFINGLDLLTMADRKPDKKLAQKVVAQIAFKVCAGLDYAHKKKVVHRDIKPANIMISSKREVKLMDFGIARILASESDDHPQIAGTLAYMAPEVLQGEKPDARCDIYALGLTMYQLIAGKIAFDGNKASEIIDQHINKAPPPLEGCDGQLAKIVFQCLEKKPNARFQTAGHLRIALGKYLGLDEGDKLSKMKSKIEYEQRKLERDRRQVEFQARQLEDKRDEARSSASSISSIPIPGHPSQKEAGFSLPVKLAAVAVGAGLAGAQLKIMITEGQLIEFESLRAYQIVPWALLGILTVSVPAFFRNGILGCLIGAATGAIGGVLTYSIDAATSNYLIDHEIWVTHFMFTYLPMALFFSAGAVASQIFSLKAKSAVKLGLTVIGAALLSAVFPYMEIAESFGLSLDTSIYFYAPLLSVLIWVCLDITESRLE